MLVQTLPLSEQCAESTLCEFTLDNQRLSILCIRRRSWRIDARLVDVS